jgi:hypothetical protein
MTRVRALLALSLVTSGAMLGGLSLSGYYEPRLAQSPAVTASPSSEASASASLAPQGRLRFVAAADERPAETTPAPATRQPKVPAKALTPTPTPLAKPKAETKERPRRQHVATPWPWSIFGD